MQRLQECLLQERVKSGMAPGSSYGTTRTASHMQPQVSWTSEGLSRQLDPNFSHAGHTAAVNDANREEPSLHHSQHHASSESNGNDIPYAQSRFRVKAAQHQQPGMRAGEHVMSSWEGTFFHTSDRTSCFDWLYVMYLTFITWFSLYMMIHHHTKPHHTTPHRTAPHRTTPHCTTPHLTLHSHPHCLWQM